MWNMSLSFISVLVCLAVIAAVMLLVFVTIQDYGSSYEDTKLTQVRETVLSSVSQCYALEGAYPPDLAYLENNYGLILDRSRYIYYYETIASNIFPEVKVFPLRKSGG